MPRDRVGLPAVLVAGLLALSAPMPADAQIHNPYLIQQGDLGNQPAGSYFKRPKVDKPLQHGKIVRGKRNVAAAWFSDATKRYRHDPFGTGLHPGTLRVSTTGNRTMRLAVPDDSVFEDVAPRLADLDGDGTDEIVVVKGYIHKGAALAVVKVFKNAMTIIAETPPIGTPFRWMNPAGIADFDGDGKPDIAVVVTPHIGGVLQFWTLRGGKLELLAETGDVSNHVLGSLHLDLSAVADFNGDGIADLAVPDQARRLLRFISLKNGRIVTLGETWLIAPASENFGIEMVRGRPAVRVGLAGGRTQVVSPCRDVSGWQMEKGWC